MKAWTKPEINFISIDNTEVLGDAIKVEGINPPEPQNVARLMSEGSGPVIEIDEES